MILLSWGDEMRKSKTSLLSIIMLVVTQVATAQSDLSQSEMEALIQKLTENPRETWLTQGSLNAVCVAYRAPALQDEQTLQSIIREKSEGYVSKPNKAQKTPALQAQFLEAIPFNTRYGLQNESTRVTSEYIIVDGEKFHCETSINSHQDSLAPGPRLAQNPYVRKFNLATNAQRVFNYDGRLKSEYYQSANLAIEEESLGTPGLPRALSAGLIPWGKGFLTRESIMESNPSASIRRIARTEYILLEFQHEQASVSATLDSSKSLAVLDCTITRSDGLVTDYDLSDYMQVNGQWIPMSIYVEQHIPDKKRYRLLKSEQWQLDILESTIPSTTVFSPKYDEEALIKYFSPLTKSPLHYIYRSQINTDELLTQRLFALTDNRPKNCATAAIEYISQKLEVPLTEAPATIVDYSGMTSLYDMEKFFVQQGLFTKAIKTTVDKLPLYKNYFVIVHLPDISHFVIVESVNSEKVWTLDLSSNDFYMSHTKDYFQANWIEGTALLVSSQAITVPAEPDLDPVELQIISGGGFQCLPEQDVDVILCSKTPGGTCIGEEEVYFAYSICKPASFGQCEDNLVVLSYRSSYCDNTPVWHGQCDAGFMYILTVQACDGLVPR
ncbi:MAG: hypothetical protein K9N55_10095 [Phycisphaerae bacterium]|nr:hypothetical protein [Phycisphaerae bacterium]